MNKDKPKFRNGGFEYKLTNNFHEMLCMHNQMKRVSTEEEKNSIPNTERRGSHPER